MRLNDTGYTIAPGHRLRLVVSASYWPSTWPTPAKLTLTLDTESSHIEVAVLEATSDAVAAPNWEPPRTPPPLDKTSRQHSRQERTTTHDIESGVGRGEWQTRTQGRLTLACSADTFFGATELDTFEGDNRIFSRNWHPQIPRGGF